MNVLLKLITPKKIIMTKAVKWLLIANIVAYLIQMVFNINAICGLYYVGHPYFHVFQFVTYMFMHAGFWHLFFNMFALWMFGRIIEQTWGWKRFLIYYFICGFGAAAVQEIGQATGLISAAAMTIGASGAIYGILLAFGMLYPNEKMFIIPIPFPIKAKYFVMGYVLIELFEGFTSSGEVAHFAHLGGMLVGFFLILYWRRKTFRSSSYFSKPQWKTTSTSPKMDVTYNKNEHSSDYEFNAKKKEQNEEIDRILDKVRKYGYSNLTEEEKKKLFEASK